MGVSKLRTFDMATRFEDLVIDLNLPSLAIPLNTFKSIIEGKDRDSGKEEPT